MIGTDYLHALCIEGQVYKTDPLPQCDSNQFLILESTPGSPATKKKKFEKDESVKKCRQKDQGNRLEKNIFTEF